MQTVVQNSAMPDGKALREFFYSEFFRSKGLTAGQSDAAAKAFYQQQILGSFPKQLTGSPYDPISHLPVIFIRNGCKEWTIYQILE